MEQREMGTKNMRNRYMPAQGGRMQQYMPAHNHMVDGNKLRKIIDQASFAMDDTRLFLDTHPDCSEAMAYYKKMERIRRDAIKEYEMHCGPMLAYQTSEGSMGEWNWNMGPLPWENQCCNGRRV